MNYEKIVNIPIHNEYRAKQILNDLLYNRVYYLFFVIGEDELTYKILNMASDMAGSKSDPTMVVSIPVITPVVSVIEGLHDTSGKLNDISTVIAFTTSIMDKVSDVIYRSEDNIDLLRIWKAYEIAFNSNH
jgi:hypothetical protein